MGQVRNVLLTIIRRRHGVANVLRTDEATAMPVARWPLPARGLRSGASTGAAPVPARHPPSARRAAQA
ncbi:hypothetical protein AB0L40_25945 [Patulibacter sp. NPDC049589]|uniref:hypothetical protein n=1 Tax=Patulibacter sp. NPDC049589 TaxID=3154731 RepID=UPI003429E285